MDMLISMLTSNNHEFVIAQEDIATWMNNRIIKMIWCVTVCCIGVRVL